MSGYTWFEPPSPAMEPGPSLDQQAQQYNWTPEYKAVQQDNEAIRAVMAAYNQPYWVTGTGSMAEGGNSLAILPQMAEAAGITPTQGMLSGYQGVVGNPYQSGTTTTYNPANDSYAVSSSPYNKQEAIANLAAYYKGLGYSPESSQAPVQMPQKPTYGSPYNPSLITPNPNGSGTPYGSTHPAEGMVGGNTGGSYTDRMNQYYNSYFKDAPGIDQNMLNDWYSTGYSPAPTGFSTGNKGASSAQGLVNSLNWGTPEWDAQSTPKLFNYMNMYGLKAADVAKALGFTEQQIIDHFKKYNIDVTKLGESTSKAPTTSNSGWEYNGWQNDAG